MIRIFHKINFCLILLLAIPWTAQAQHNRYQSDLLSHMAEALQMRSVLDTLTNGVYLAQHQYKSLPLNIIINEGEVEHIGYAIFPAEMRKANPSPVYNFLERYALQASLPLRRTKTVDRQLYEDDVTFTVGSISILPTLWGKDNVEFSLENLQQRICKATWSQNGKVICSVCFPVSYNLYHGTDLVENQRRLIEDLRRASVSVLDVEKSVPVEQLAKILEPDYFLQKGDSLYISSLNSDTYYVKGNDDEFRLLFSDKHPVESFANLLTTNSISNDIHATIKLVLYDFKSETIDVPLVNMLSYFKKKGCKAYFGIIQSEREQHTAELLLLNRDEGYCHTLKLNFSTSNVASRSGTISGRMNCYVPISKIKFLFEEKKK